SGAVVDRLRRARMVLIDPVLDRCQRGWRIDVAGYAGRKERDQHSGETGEDAEQVVEVLLGELVGEEEERDRPERHGEHLAEPRVVVLAHRTTRVMRAGVSVED